MAEYQKIEYRIGKDGKISEKVIDGSGSSCLDATKEIEEALGKVDSQELLPEYYEGEEYLTAIETQSGASQWLNKTQS
ncbi:MAG: DUF2997 domain-containing protein [Okeania sp. SIO2H7]|nr:DUF2997 domain-containing protein [Okeania sp. SIO2H7]